MIEGRALLALPGRSVCPCLEWVGGLLQEPPLVGRLRKLFPQLGGSANSKALSLVAWGLLILSSDYLVLTYVSIPFYR